MFVLISLIFFLITAASFTSLGVILPYMIKEMGWTRMQAGIGFSLLALMVGLSAPIPAYLLRRVGLKATYALGGVMVIGGTSLMATTTGLTQFYIGAAFIGFGYSHCASVPAVYFLNNWIPDKHSFAMGIFMMIGGMGGVAAPFVVTGVVRYTGTWQAYWWIIAVSMFTLTILGLIFFKDVVPQVAEKLKKVKKNSQQKKSRVHKSLVDWTLKEALRTPQYYIIVLALTAILLSSVTMNSWAFTHMTSLGVAATVAAIVLSMQAVVNALSRALGGSLANYIDPRWLLASALAADAIGMIGLSFADNYYARIVFILADGYGFGMCFFATVALLVNYYGMKASPEIVGSMNFFTVTAMVGPTVAGIIGDGLGGFAWVYRGLSGILLVLFFVVVAMRPPRHSNDLNAEDINIPTR